MVIEAGVIHYFSHLTLIHLSTKCLFTVSSWKPSKRLPAACVALTFKLVAFNRVELTTNFQILFENFSHISPQS